MSDKLYPMELTHLLKWILEEEKHGSIFGVTKELFFNPSEQDVFRMKRYGQLMETPIGVAAGPHTQMAQNIILAWLMGARYIELKTIQTLDELEVSKPCIDMQDEGYNCEWSQELKLNQSFSEYLNAWIIIHILKDKFGWGYDKDLGGIFNMSAGYNLVGIKKPNVQQFLDLMEDCQPNLDDRLNSIEHIYPNIKNLSIPAKLSDNLTLSTMHGCPPDEIESIGKYLIEERKYHMTVKLNPTLLGPDKLREILNNRLGFKEVTVPDEAFSHDLKYYDALKLIKSLQSSAENNGVDFGLKLTNTLEVENHKPIFPSNEKMMYMSGRALHPISIHVAEKLQTEFNGNLDISFSAGMDAFNVADVLAANIKPITVCTDILKPGGYTRLAQYLSEIKKQFADTNASTIDEFILSKDNVATDLKTAGLNNLKYFAESVLNHAAYHKDIKHFESIKTPRPLTRYDCVKAPCTESCATDQEIPEYLHQVANGNFDKAYETILRTNAMPGVTGYVCDHLCQTKCTRNNLDSTLLIREIKRFATENNSVKTLVSKPSNGLKTAVIGAGPSGLTCAYYLALEGFEVDIYEAKPFAGGMVSDAIPGFRLTNDSIKNDIELVKSVGVKFHFNSSIDKNRFNELRSNYDYVYLGAGAQDNKRLNIQGEESSNVIEPLTFLSDVRQGNVKELGERVAVIGGGNTAMDAARTSRRLGSDVTILYRRTMKEMPADMEEIVAALEEGIYLQELVAPEKIADGGDGPAILTCFKMELGKPDESGRERPIKIDGSEFELAFDKIIPAVGQDIALDYVTWQELVPDNVTGETKLKNVFAGGDIVRGASSVINAVGDGRKAADNIIRAAKLDNHHAPDSSLRFEKFEYQKKLALREYGITTPHLSPDERINFNLVTRTLAKEEAMAEASRCLQCDDVCDVCVSVCPNLANMSYIARRRTYPVYQLLAKDDGVNIIQIDTFTISQEPQIINIGDFCNECGNCTTFCPTAGDPYKTKPKFFLNGETFDAEENGYWMDGNTLFSKMDGIQSSLNLTEGNYRYKSDIINIKMDSSNYEIISAQFLNGKSEMQSSDITEMIVLFENMKDYPLFNTDK